MPIQSFLSTWLLIGAAMAHCLPGCTDGPPTTVARLSPPSPAPSASPQAMVEFGEWAQIAQESFSRRLVPVELERVESAPDAQTEYLVGAIREMESTGNTTWFEIPTGAYDSNTTGVCGALRHWAVSLKSSESLGATEFFAEFGVAALFADVAVHGGSGDPTLRALVSASGRDLSEFDTTEAAEFGRRLPEIFLRPDMESKVQWILSTTMTTRMRSLYLFNLGDGAVDELAHLYQESGGGGAYGVGHDELAWLLGSVAMGRKHPAVLLLQSQDSSQPRILEYAQSLQDDLHGAFDYRMALGRIFYVGERQFHILGLPASEQWTYRNHEE